VDVDPDIGLYARLALGRGTQLVLTLAVFFALLVASASGLVSATFVSALPPGPGRMLGGALPALALLLFAPSRAVARLFELERDGLLDQIRLCGRTPRRMLTASLVGSLTPFVLLSAALLFARNPKGDLTVVVLAVAVLCAALTASLLVYGVLPASAAPQQQFLTPLFVLVSLAAVVALGLPVWGEPQTITAIGLRASVAVALLPLSAWVANRRMAHPSYGHPPASTPRRGVWLRVLPRDGPPELMRQLRSALISSGTLGSLIVGPLIVVLTATAMRGQPLPLETMALNAIPYFLLLSSGVIVSLTIRAELEAGRLDLVRLTTQRAESVVIGWYAALALPTWIAAVLTMLALVLTRQVAVEWSWWLPALAIVAPAVGLAEGLCRRRPGVYLVLPLLFFVVAWTYASGQDLRVFDLNWKRALAQADRDIPLTPSFAEVRALRDRPEDLRRAMLAWREQHGRRMRQAQAHVDSLPGAALRTVTSRDRLSHPRPTPWGNPLLLTLVLVAALGIAAGRIRRAIGPSLEGAAAAAGVAAVAIVLAATFPIVAFPRLLPAALVMLASFAAADRPGHDRAWRPIAFGAVAAVVVGVALARQGGIDWIWSADTGLAAALALAAGVLLHESTAHAPLLSWLMRATIAAAILRSWWTPELAWKTDSFPVVAPIVPLAPPALRLIELLALTTCVLALSWRHWRSAA
jgi:hypothetical protein